MIYTSQIGHDNRRRLDQHPTASRQYDYACFKMVSKNDILKQKMYRSHRKMIKQECTDYIGK